MRTHFFSRVMKKRVPMARVLATWQNSILVDLNSFIGMSKNKDRDIGRRGILAPAAFPIRPQENQHLSGTTGLPLVIVYRTALK
jgi:hypothetical protein